MLVGLSPYRYGYTWPSPFGDPARQGSYYALAVGERFEDLGAVPLISKNPVTGACNAFPTRRGYTDAAACVSEDGGEPAWVAATFTTQGFLWFALKNANDFPLTLLWMANHGRHASPWYGRENWLGARRHPRILRRGLARIGRTKFSLGRRGADRVYGDAAKARQA